MQDLHRMQKTDFGAKAIVFSQFTSMLDIIKHRISTDRFSSGYDHIQQCQRICFTSAPTKVCSPHGEYELGSAGSYHSPVQQRPPSESSFDIPQSRRGSLEPHCIFIMDPWWSPAAEMQAIDRTHCFDQHKPIHATRFITEGAIEERILRLQEKKRLVFDATIGGDAGSVNKLTTADMAFLFA